MRRAYLEHQIAAESGYAIDDLDANCHVGFIRRASSDAGTRLQPQRVALALELPGRLRGHGHTGFARSRLKWDANDHRRSLAVILNPVVSLP
ncbi:hypothetical protein D3C71_2025620 [compost metagenome]